MYVKNMYNSFQNFDGPVFFSTFAVDA